MLLLCYSEEGRLFCSNSKKGRKKARKERRVGKGGRKKGSKERRKEEGKMEEPQWLHTVKDCRCCYGTVWIQTLLPDGDWESQARRLSLVTVLPPGLCGSQVAGEQ